MATYDVMLVSAAGLALVMLGVFSGLWHSNIDGVREWLAANMLALLAYPLYSLGWKYDVFLSLEVANTLYAGTSLLIAVGFARFFGREPHYPRLLLMLGALFVALCWLHYGVDLPRARVIVITAFHLAIGITILYTLRLRHHALVAPFPHAFATLMTVVMIAFALIRVLMQAPFVLNNALHLPFDLEGPAIVFLTLGLLILPALSLAGATMVTSRLVLLAREEAKTDFLTGAWSRRGLLEFAERELERAKRTGSPVSLLLIDIDDFKRINDSFGHPVGDAVLTELVLKAGTAVRNIDYLCRMGGEEFAVLMPDTDLQSAADAAERLRQALSTTASGSIHYTVSIGVAQDHGEGWGKLYRAADSALGMAKKGGKNCVMVASDQAPARHKA